MKRGKDDEKIVPEPMFPRLHVNDADKGGGPRAPPRNKMALYEQFSIPSQRFCSSTKLIHPPLSSQVRQGSDPERNIHFPIQQSSRRGTHISGTNYSRHVDEADSNASVAQPPHKRMRGDEDDFMVPVFVKPGMDQDITDNQNDMTGRRLTETRTGHSIQTNNVCAESPSNSRSFAHCSRQETKSGNAAVLRDSLPIRQHLREQTANIGSRDPIYGSPSRTDFSTYQLLENSDANMNQSIPNARSQQNQRGRLRNDNSNCHYVDELRKSMEDITSRVRSNSNSGEVDNDCDYNQDEAFNTLKSADADKSDDGSDTSMVESIGSEFTPDDVVGIIGQKHFWNARRSIANQQRLLAVQVFELHRLLKVQKLIAGSPKLMFEDASLTGLPSLKISSAKTLSSECIVKPLVHVLSRKDSLEKPNYTMEHSAENAVKTSHSLVKNGTQASSKLLYQADQSPMPVVADTKVAPWGFHQPYGHRWLIPVMSPSEGLIYKPYPGPGFVGTNNGGSLPVGSTPIPCGYMNPAYGYPQLHHYPGHGVPPGATVANLQVQSNHLSGGGSISNVPPQKSIDLATKQSGAILEAAKLQISNGSELQGSIVSSPSGREQGNGMVPSAEEVDVLSLFPFGPSHQGGAQLGRVIKVVPHNPRSATESAARIFQSIQKERNQS